MPRYFRIKTEIIFPLNFSDLVSHRKVLLSAIPQGDKCKFVIYMRLVKFVARMDERRGIYRFLVGET
jgi:hypothetical protein